MTTTDHPDLRSRSISARRAATDQLEAGYDRDLAELRLAEMVYIRACQELRDTGASEKCSRIDLMKDGVANPNRPFITGECCELHRALRHRRDALDARAKELGVERNRDMTMTVLP